MKLINLTAAMLIISALISPSLSAEEKSMVTSVAVSKETKIIVAVHPYLSSSLRKIFNLRGRIKKSVPIGVMIQNYGDEKISIENIDIVSDAGDMISTPKYTPYSQRTLGGIAQRDFFEDGEMFNVELQREHMKSEKIPMLSMNEVFYKPWLEPGKSFYGLIYPEKRNKKYVPVKMSYLSGLMLRIYFRSDNLLRKYVATLSLEGAEGNSIRLADVPKINPKRNFECLNVNCNKIGEKLLYEINSAFADCYALSYGKYAGNEKIAWGKYSRASIKFNKNGDYLSHAHLEGSCAQYDKILDAIARGMKHCDLPYSDHKINVSDGEPFYSFIVSVGDTFAEVTNDKVRDQSSVSDARNTLKSASPPDPEYIEYQSAIREKITHEWQIPKECSGAGVVRITFMIDESGNITQAGFVDRGTNDKCDESMMNAIYAASPLPLPPSRLEWEASKEGFVVEFVARTRN